MRTEPTAVARACYPQQHTQDHDGMGMDAGRAASRTGTVVHVPAGVSGAPLASSEAIETFDVVIV